MLHRTGFLVALLAGASFALFNTGAINAAEMQQPAQDTIHGKVTDIIEAAGYTYAEVDTGKERVWAATSTTPIKVGDMIAFTTEMPMQNFHSSSLNRDFPMIYFVNRFITDAGASSRNAGSKPAPAAGVIEGIDKVAGGNTIAEVYTDRQALGGKVVRVRGQVTRFTADIMGKNWLHIRDSSTLDDLTVTTDATVAVDDIVVIEGKLALDKDFGYGYVYPLIVQDAGVEEEVAPRR